MNQLAKPQQTQPVNAHQETVRMGFTTLQSFELMQRAAKLLSAAQLVPKEYQNNIPNCTIALNMANRIGADPLMVMQNLVIVHGKPTWSSQFLIATVNTCGRFTALRYSCSIGGTHLTQLAGAKDLPGPRATLFFAPAQGK